MKIVLDSDVLVFALHVPHDRDLAHLHEKASKLYESCIKEENVLLLSTTILVEAVSVLSKIITPEFARASRKDIVDTSMEIFPLSPSGPSYSTSEAQRYIDLCLEYATNSSKIEKDPGDSTLAGWKEGASQVRISGMDVFIIAYADLRDAVLITNDWSLWYAAWKSGMPSYWLSGLSGGDMSRVVEGQRVEYPA